MSDNVLQLALSQEIGVLTEDLSAHHNRLLGYANNYLLDIWKEMPRAEYKRLAEEYRVALVGRAVIVDNNTVAMSDDDMMRLLILGIAEHRPTTAIKDVLFKNDRPPAMSADDFDLDDFANSPDVGSDIDTDNPVEVAFRKLRDEDFEEKHAPDLESTLKNIAKLLGKELSPELGAALEEARELSEHRAQLERGAASLDFDPEPVSDDLADLLDAAADLGERLFESTSFARVHALFHDATDLPTGKCGKGMELIAVTAGAYFAFGRYWEQYRKESGIEDAGILDD